MERVNLNNMEQGIGVSPQGKPMADPAIADINKIITLRFENGEAPLDILVDLLNQGMDPNALGLPFELIGFDPAAFTQLMQDAEIVIQKTQAEQQAQAVQAQQQQQANVSAEEVLEKTEETKNSKMQLGGSYQPFETNAATGPLADLDKRVKRPVYTSPLPDQANVIGATYLFSDAVGKLFSGQDRNNDGVMDGTFRDNEAKRARYKNMQNQTKSYEIDFQGNDPEDYMLNMNDLAKGTVKTKDQYLQDLIDNSLITGFNPETQRFSGYMASGPEDLNMIGKKQQEELGILEGNNSANKLSSFLGRVQGLDPEQLEQMVTQLEGRDKETKGTGLDANFDQYTDEDLTAEELQEKRRQYTDIMTLGTPLTNSRNNIINFPQTANTGADNIINFPKEKSIVEVDNQKEDFRQWYAKNYQKYLGADEKTLRSIYKAQSEFKHGGAYLPKAQMLGEFNSSSGMGGVYADQLDFENLMNNIQTDYTADIQAVADSQLQKENPALGATPLQNQQAITGSGPGSGMGSMFLDQQALQKELEGINQTDQTTDTTVTNESFEPSVKRKRTASGAINQVKNFINNDPTVQKFADVSDFLVKGANLATEFFKERDLRDFKREQRSMTMADKTIAMNYAPEMARGSQSVQDGLFNAESMRDGSYGNIIKFGRELYKKGGEFEPHMMYNPKTNKGYKANVPADHERMAEMGYLHADEMKEAGKKMMSFGGELEVDNDTLAALIAAGADIEIL